MAERAESRYFEIARLVRESRKGAQESFRLLLEMHQKAIAATLFACGIRCRETAEDLAQDVAIRAWTRLPSLSDPRSFPAWIRRIAANAARDELRKTSTRRENALDEALHIEGGTSPEELSRRAAEIRMMLLALSGEDEEILMLLRARAEGVPIARMATEAGITEAAMKMRLMRVRKRLRKRLDTLKGDGGQ